MYYFYDATYILVLIGAVISIIASMNVKSTFNRYSKGNHRTNMTGATGLMQIGVLLFSLVVLFQFLTLPVEFDASARALRTLRSRNMLSGNELSGARKVLTAAALTYVAALVTSILQLLRLILLTRRND